MYRTAALNRVGLFAAIVTMQGIPERRVVPGTAPPIELGSGGISSCSSTAGEEVPFWDGVAGVTLTGLEEREGSRRTPSIDLTEGDLAGGVLREGDLAEGDLTEATDAVDKVRGRGVGVAVMGFAAASKFFVEPTSEARRTRGIAVGVGTRGTRAAVTDRTEAVDLGRLSF